MIGKTLDRNIALERMISYDRVFRCKTLRVESGLGVPLRRHITRHDLNVFEFKSLCTPVSSTFLLFPTPLFFLYVFFRIPLISFE
jgi:hypothetical protein